MCDRICKTCGGDDVVAKIGEAMGFRPDIAFRRIRNLEDALSELIGIAEQCDGWESFPNKALDDARDILGK